MFIRGMVARLLLLVIGGLWEAQQGLAAQGGWYYNSRNESRCDSAEIVIDPSPQAGPLPTSLLTPAEHPCLPALLSA